MKILYKIFIYDFAFTFVSLSLYTTFSEHSAALRLRCSKLWYILWRPPEVKLLNPNVGTIRATLTHTLADHFHDSQWFSDAFSDLL